MTLDIGLTNLPKGIVIEVLTDSVLVEDIDTKEEVILKADSFMIELLKESHELNIITYDPLGKKII